MEKRVGRPDFAGHEIVETEHCHGTFELQPLVLPALPEEHIDGVLLQDNTAFSHPMHGERLKNIVKFSFN